MAIPFKMDFPAVASIEINSFLIKIPVGNRFCPKNSAVTVYNLYTAVDNPIAGETDVGQGSLGSVSPLLVTTTRR